MTTIIGVDLNGNFKYKNSCKTCYPPFSIQKSSWEISCVAQAACVTRGKKDRNQLLLITFHDKTGTARLRRTYPKESYSFVSAERRCYYRLKEYSFCMSDQEANVLEENKKRRDAYFKILDEVRETVCLEKNDTTADYMIEDIAHHKTYFPITIENLVDYIVLKENHLRNKFNDHDSVPYFQIRNHLKIQTNYRHRSWVYCNQPEINIPLETVRNYIHEILDLKMKYLSGKRSE